MEKTIKQMQILADNRLGKCLSDEYKNAHFKLKWECNLGHIWEAEPNEIKKGTWCPYCNHPIDINYLYNRIYNIIKEREGKCLSKYINSKTKVECECSNGHKFNIIPNHLLRGIWCPYCSGNNKKDILDMQKLANLKNGKCLSIIYKNNHTKIEWQCTKSHKWFATPTNINQGHWCPYCNQSIMEKFCRENFEILTNKKFKKVRPTWLIYNKQPLELDGFNEELLIAFEYNGIQHYKEIDFFHKSTNLKDKINFKEIKKHDKFKEEKCKEKGILLIIIPYTIKKKNLKNYIEERLQTKTKFLQEVYNDK